MTYFQAPLSYNQYIAFFKKIGPSSYPTGGFVVDLSSTFSSITSFGLTPQKGNRGSLPFGREEFILNSPSAGKVTVKLQGYQYSRVSSLDNITGQPSGVTIQAASGSKVSADTTHTHDMTHDHAAQASAAMTAAGAGVDTDALGQALDAHTHSVDVPSQAFTSGAGSSHDHTDNSLYDHTHSTTYTVTNVSAAEVTNATNLSTTTFWGRAVGVRA